MSNEKKNPYQYDPFDYNHHEINKSSFPFFNYGTSSIYQNPPHDPQTLNGFGSDHPNSFMSFTDCLHGSLDYNTLSKAFDMSCSSSEVISRPLDHDNNSNKQQAAAAGVGDHSVGTNSTTENPSTPNYSSISSSPNEAAGAGAVAVAVDHQVLDEDSDHKSKKDKQPKLRSDGDDEDKSKKGSKAKKKEKRKREPRFAFLTKSEVDHLEDGYRWRKYGQKAVKNSPYPRSYYRCTTQKCIVKKRVERSFQDSSTVITTYEGQHNHQCPATLRGNLNLNAVGMLSPNSLLASASLSGSARFSHEFLAQFLPMDNQLQLQSHQHDHPPSSTLYSTLMSPHRHHHNQQQQQLPASDYDLLRWAEKQYGFQGIAFRMATCLATLEG
nr:WRKY transcription factor 28-like isoform X4 [Malus domestica]